MDKCIMGKEDDEATELALRAAFLRDREDGELLDLRDILKDAQAYRRQFSHSGNFRRVLSDVSDAQSIQEAAIKTAFKGLQYVYDRVSDKIHIAQEQHDELSYEIEAEFASFSVPRHGVLSNEERSMKAFYELADKAETSWLVRYLGITKQESQEITGKTYYRVLPLFKVSQYASQSFASPSMLDEVRTDINLFLGVELPEVLGVIEASFHKRGATTIGSLRATPDKTRLARIFILALGRLLWGLSHQVDLNGGAPSTTQRCFERCSRAQIYLNSILNSSKPPCLENETKEDKCLIGFIRSADDLIKDLRCAYATEQLQELNMGSLTNSVYKSLNILTKGIFTLLYRRHDFGEKKYLPDETAAASIQKDLAALTRLLKIDDSRLEPFRRRAALVPKVAFLNETATTLVDVLIIFCHLSHENRKVLMAELNAKRNDEGHEVEWASQLARRLKIFEKHFITPVEYQGEVYQDSSEPFQRHSFFSKLRYSEHHAQERAVLAGKRLIPFLTLLMATRYPTTYALSGEDLTRVNGLEEAYLNANVHMPRSGWQQIKAINTQAKNQSQRERMTDNTEENAYFSCCMSLFMYGSADVNPELDVLPILHDRMRDLAHLLELVSKIHKQLSKSRIFYSFFINFLDWVRDEQISLGQEIAPFKIDSKHGVNRYIQEILLPMELDLIENFKEVQRAVKDSKRTVTDSKFIERIAENSAKDIQSIHKLVLKLFKKDSNLLQLISRHNTGDLTNASFEPSPTDSALTRSSSEDTRALQKYALQDLMERSYQSMSYMSRFYSKKGPLLSELIAEVSLKRVLSDQELQNYLEKLIRIASSYRKISFFPFAEASYGSTETMRQAIIPAMKNARINAVLPFSAVLFNGYQADLISMSDKKIIQALEKQCKEHHWERSEDEIFEGDFLTSSNASSPVNNHPTFERYQHRQQASDDALTPESESGHSQALSDLVVNF
jgi:hypothetical protein